MTNESKTTLLEIAKQINSSVVQMHEAGKMLRSGRYEIGKLLVEVKNRLKKESNMSFGEWCKNNIRKVDGNPFSYITLTNYMKYANNPEIYKKETQRQNNYSKQRRDALKYLGGTIPENTTMQDEVNRLVYAWDHASNEARKQFLDIIGGQLND